jgi:hypothetical protein
MTHVRTKVLVYVAFHGVRASEKLELVGLQYADVCWSKAVEDEVASVIRCPLSNDTELAFLLAHCLEGDVILYQKVADGLDDIGDSCGGI